jgi:hypothetical protein
MDGNKKAVQRATKAKVHLTTSFINSFKHDEIGVGCRINIRGWRFIFSNFLVCAARVCFARSRDLENQKLLCVCSTALHITKLLFLR